MKTGMTGLMAIVNATDEAYNSLTDSVQNATATVSYWNENLGQAGVKGKECSDRIENLKQVLSETEYMGAAFNMTTQDMALALQVLSSDAKVTAEDVEDLFNVLSVMRDPTKQQAKVMKELGLTYREVGDSTFGYSETCAMVDSSIVGLTQSQKKQIKSQLDANMTLEEANKVLQKYNLTAQSASTGQIDFIANLTQLRDKFKDMDEATRESVLTNLGLSESLDEINEICNMSNDTFDMYCKNLDLATGMSRKLAEAMDETTKNSFLELASALEDVGIEAFERLKTNINNASNSLTEFFNVWRSGLQGGNDFSNQALYTFENFKLALDGLLQDIRNADIAGAIGTAINGAVTFVTQGGLSRVLAIGTEIIHQICQGIINNRDEINEGISSTIKQIAGFVKENAGEIGEAGRVILEALNNGIKDNKNDIHQALDAVAGAMNSWVSGSEQIKSLTGNFADIFVDSFIENTIDRITGKGSELWTGFWSTLVGGDTSKPPKTALDTIIGWFTGEAYAGETTGNEKPLNGSKKPDKNTNKVSDKLTNMNTAEIQALQQELNNLKTTIDSVAQSTSQSFGNMQNAMRDSLVGCANITRNQFMNMTNIVRNQALNCSNIVRNQFLNMTNIIRNQSLNASNIVRNQFVNMTNIVRNQSLNCSNIVRNQFVSMTNIVRNQSLNCSNIVRNQFVSISNVVRNQATNARNAFTSQFISLSKVASTQSANARNAITAQMISINKVVTTQATNARNNFTRQMISIASVARTQSTQAGRYIATGLASGIRSGTASAVAAARAMVNQVNAVVRSAAKIASPSKVTTEYGDFYGQGFGVGIKKSMPNVVKSAIGQVKGLNERIRATVNSEVAKVSVNTKAVSTNNIVSSTTQDSAIREADIKRLESAINNKPTVVQVDIGEKTIVKAIAKPMKNELEKMDARDKRLEGK